MNLNIIGFQDVIPHGQVNRNSVSEDNAAFIFCAEEMVSYPECPGGTYVPQNIDACLPDYIASHLRRPYSVQGILSFSTSMLS